MGKLIGLGGYASNSGVTVINAGVGKVVSAYRNSDGTISAKELSVCSKLLKFYKLKIEKVILNIPIVSEVLKIIILFGVTFSSYIIEIFNVFFLREKWSLKKFSILILAGLSCYIYAFLNIFYMFLPLIPLLLLLKNEIINTLKYHGAEHKVINMYEYTNNVDNVTIESVKKFSKIHNRCGSNLIILIIPIGLLVYLITEVFFPTILIESSYEILWSIAVLIIGTKMLQLFQKPVLSKLLRPGLFIQKYLTTREPDDQQIEVALCALKFALQE
jgi:uncharacterized protein YqhQ